MNELLLVPDLRAAYDCIVDAVRQAQTNICNIIFLDAMDGTGKTYLIKSDVILIDRHTD